MLNIREKHCLSVLSESALADYALNPYTGCLHGCAYCYARFMRRFSGHREPWGEFLDVKVNAPLVLAREAKKNPKGEVFISSVCDAWQPAEVRYRLTRQCLKILVEEGFTLRILTKSSLILRDLDLLRGYPDVLVGFTLTTTNEELRKRMEPGASGFDDRIMALEKLRDNGIKAWAFMGPLLPFLSDSEESINALFKAISPMGLELIYIDKLNNRPGVWPSLRPLLKRYYPWLMEPYIRLLFHPGECKRYSHALKARVTEVARGHGVEGKLSFCF